MPHPQRIGSLEVEQDLDYQRREWVFERVGWLAMLLLVLAALAGLLGTGALSSTSIGSADGPLRMEYDRFVHYRDPNTLRMLIDGSQVVGGKTRVWFDRGYLDGVQIENIMPEPEQVVADGTGDTFVFLTEGNEAVRVVFHFSPDQFGWLEGRVQVGSGPKLDFGQFVYP
jgi:hypothetical protein